MNARIRSWIRCAAQCALTLLVGVAGVAWAGMPVDLERELKLLREGRAQVHIEGARYRFAVFAYEDPDGTGLGDALATIVAHDLLMNGKVSSLGVIRYVGGLGTASGERQLRYFDKVEPLIEFQKVQVAIWGIVRRVGDAVEVDSYLQLSPAALGSAFTYRFPLPTAAGPMPLVHRIGPDRMRAQRLRIPAADAADLAAVAANMQTLRAGPADVARAVAGLPLGAIHTLLERRGEWMRVAVAGGPSGWVRASGLCVAGCAPLLDVSRLATDLMAYDDRGALPARSASLAEDARFFVEQLTAIQALDRDPTPEAAKAVLHGLEPRCVAPGAVPTAGGAAACNLVGVLWLVAATREAAFHGTPRALDPGLLRFVAGRLAEASLADPRHGPTLQNLAVLFSALDDPSRAALARELAAAAAK